MEAGAPDPQRQGGPVTVYFHGQPGSADELALFGAIAPADWVLPDRAVRPGAPGIAGHFDSLASQIDAHSDDRPIRLVGFSLGAYLALEVAARLPGADIRVDLVSPAAPLSSGDFLDDMAGKAVFSLAARHPRLFDAVAAMQGILARTFPGLLCDLLFASARGADAVLYRDPAFRAAMARIVGTGLGHDNPTYRSEIHGYVADWSPLLLRIDHPVTLWQGQSDNWSPPAMAEALASLLPRVVAVHRFEGCSHYSTLREFLRESGDSNWPQVQ